MYPHVWVQFGVLIWSRDKESKWRSRLLEISSCDKIGLPVVNGEVMMDQKDLGKSNNRFNGFIKTWE